MKLQFEVRATTSRLPSNRETARRVKQRSSASLLQTKFVNSYERRLDRPNKRLDPLDQTYDVSHDINESNGLNSLNLVRP
jgi:hypothetical protein